MAAPADHTPAHGPIAGPEGETYVEPSPRRVAAPVIWAAVAVLGTVALAAEVGPVEAIMFAGAAFLCGAVWWDADRINRRDDDRPPPSPRSEE